MSHIYFKCHSIRIIEKMILSFFVIFDFSKCVPYFARGGGLISPPKFIFENEQTKHEMTITKQVFL